jgi:hypothetical protein
MLVLSAVRGINVLANGGMPLAIGRELHTHGLMQ